MRKETRWLLTPRARRIIPSVSLFLSTVVTSALVGQEVPRIVVAPEPEIRIGSVDGPFEEAFEFLIAARPLGATSLVVADRMASEVRIFDRDGQFLTRFGRRGQGPSEFQYIARVDVAGDTILVHDQVLGKVVKFSSAGEFLESVPYPRPGATFLGAGSSGRRWWAWGRGRVELAFAGGWALEQSIGTSLPGSDEVIEIATSQGTWRAGQRPHPFSPVSSPVLFRDSLILPRPMTGELDVLSSEGQVGRTIVVPVEPNDAREAWSILERELRSRGQANLLSPDVARIREVPRFAAVLVDDREQIWVKEYDPAEDAHWLGGWAGGEGGSWLVLDADGHLRARVELQGRVVPLWLQGGFLFARLRDNLDVQYLAVYDLPSLR